MPEAHKIVFWVAFAAIIIIIIAGITGMITAPVLQSREGWENYQTPSVLASFFKFIGFPENVAQSWPAVIFYGVVPLIAVFAIFYGFLKELNIFRSMEWVNWVIALAGIFALLPTGWFAIMVALIFGLMGLYSIGVFALLFFVGVFFLAKAHYGGWSQGYFDQQIWDNEIKEMDAEMKAAKDNREVVKIAVKKYDSLTKKYESISKKSGSIPRSMRGNIEGLQNEIQQLSNDITARQDALSYDEQRKFRIAKDRQTRALTAMARKLGTP